MEQAKKQTKILLPKQMEQSISRDAQNLDFFDSLSDFIRSPQDSWKPEGKLFYNYEWILPCGNVADTLKQKKKSPFYKGVIAICKSILTLYAFICFTLFILDKFLLFFYTTLP